MNAQVLPAGVELAGAVDVERGDGYVRPWRLPVADLELHHPALLPIAGGPGGVRLRFRTAARALELDAEPADVEPWAAQGWRPSYDLVFGGVLHQTVTTPMEAGTVAFEDLPGEDKVVELWLPQGPSLRLRGLRAADGAAFAPAPPDTRPRWTVYGSSITHGKETTPSQTWPAVAARALGRNLTSLGVAGQCHLDPLVARAIATHPADHITLKLGINVHNAQSMRERAFVPAVHGFLAAVRDGHPHTPVTVVSPIYSPPREASATTLIHSPDASATATGDLTLEGIREILLSAVEVLRRRGDSALRYLDGRELLGKDEAAHLPDSLHPDPEGLRLIGERYAAVEQGRTVEK